MKKYIFWSIIYALCNVFILTSCGKDEDDEPDYNPPFDIQLTAPTGLSGRIVSNGIELSWNPVNDAEFYTVSRSSLRNGTQISLGYLGANGRIYNNNIVDTRPLAGDNYYFIYACNNSLGNSYTQGPQSSPIYVYYTGNNSGGGNDNTGGGDNNTGGGNNNAGGGTTTQKPAAPTGVYVTNDGNDYIPNVRVYWNSVSNATNYYVYKCSSANGSYSKIGESSYPQYGCVDTNPPTNGKSAYYKVKAVNSAGESPFSEYAVYTSTPNDEAFSPAYQYGNCTVSGNSITLRWTYSTGYGYGKATEAVLRVWNPYAEEWQDTPLSATATSASFNFSNKIDNDGFVKSGIVVSNAKGSFTAGVKIYDTKNRKWLN